MLAYIYDSLKFYEENVAIIYPLLTWKAGVEWKVKRSLLGHRAKNGMQMILTSELESLTLAYF